MQRGDPARSAGPPRCAHRGRATPRYPTVLEAAGAAEADIIVALTNSDEVNMLACEMAFTLFRTPTKIARIRSAEYTSRPQLFATKALSVDVFISPEQLVTEYVERLIRYPGRAAGARLRRRQGAPRRRARAERRPAGRALPARAPQHLPDMRGCASSRSIATGAACVPQATPSSRKATRCSSSPRSDDIRRVMSGAAPRRRSGAARRDRRRRPHRLSAGQDAREDQPGEAHRARRAARAQDLGAPRATPSCCTATPPTRSC